MSAVDLPVSVSLVAGDKLPATEFLKVAQVLNAVLPVGVMFDFFGLESQVANGMLACSGKTVGDASSNATARANADMEALFTHLWTIGNSDASLSIYTSAGAGSSYGANAAADWAAHKAIALPDARGRVTAGKDTMGGTDADRIVTNDAQGDKVGGVCGEENHTLTTTEIPSHTHTIQKLTGGTPNNPSISSGSASGNNGTPYTDQSNCRAGPTGGDGAHNNMQPTMFVTKIIWTGATW